MGPSRYLTWPKILIVSTMITGAVAVGFLLFPNRPVGTASRCRLTG